VLAAICARAAEDTLKASGSAAPKVSPGGRNTYKATEGLPSWEDLPLLESLLQNKCLRYWGRSGRPKGSFYSVLLLPIAAETSESSAGS
jgi:hypothetical protein